MTAVLAVLIGGAIGAPLRYLVDRYVTAATANTSFLGELPWGLLVVNGLGSAAAGAIVSTTDGPVRILLLTGICGAFTTFSGYAWEVDRLWPVRRLDYWAALFLLFVVSVGLFLLAYLAAGAITGA